MCLLPELELPAKFPAQREDSRPVTPEQAQGMDDMLSFAENEDE
jgi:hypothetical protein